MPDRPVHVQEISSLWRRLRCWVTGCQWRVAGPLCGEPAPGDALGPIRFRCDDCNREELF